MNISSEWFNWEPSLLVPAVYDLVWGTVAFLIVAWVVYKKAWPTFIATLDERREKIEDGLLAAERAREEIKAEREQLADEVTAARKDAARIREDAQESAKAIVADARSKANAEAQRIVDQAHRQIEADRVSAEAELRTDVGSLATVLAGRIIEANVADRDISRQVVDRFLDELEATTPANTEA
ncbi:F0F1 ATP synthase subunit B [Flaviflexus salsibiostraticola]|uniref:ATP synthase subunit b n=1 Tax=Flaviflexus salsibiostraticola TaxID=1282737 RepID=A0A3Q8WTF3_9ACTO|nr:F0F1 ATP synthase subunit B [Flaviflexus salsibiostraticola]AZN29904.1 F0F1 ATP synthase subunit B [Flaviflexus salsibiostraticola]